jgi:hypothetical protein
MITIIHGDNYIASRLVLNQVNQAIKLDARSISEGNLTQALESNSMFSTDEPIIIENLLTLFRSKNKQNLINIVLESNDKIIYLWDKKTVTPATKKMFKNATIKEFKLTKFVYKFLDSIKPDNQQNILKLLHQTLEKDAVELIFYFLHRRTSQLIQAIDDPKELKGAPWQIGSLKNQAKLFSLAQLRNFHQKLLTIDYEIKTGQSLLPLASRLDLLFLNI